MRYCQVNITAYHSTTTIDRQGSINGLIDPETQQMVCSVGYDPWGRERKFKTYHHQYNDTPSDYILDGNSLIIPRGYTGHEMLREFGLINMNGRVYDPLTSRFLSPDNYVQAPNNPQNYNRYSYALNNPLKYVDPDGEWVHIVIGAIIGGAINLVSNWNNIDNVWEGLAAFGAGAAQGALTATLGPTGALIGGAITGATNNIIAQTNNDAGLNTVNWGQVGVGAFVGGLSGAVGYAAGEWASSNLGGVIINGFHVSANSIIGGAITGGVGGAVGGYAGGFSAGLLMTGDLSAAHKAGVSGFWMGAGIGASAGAVRGYVIAKKEGLNIWSGRPKKSISIGGPQARVEFYADLLNSETIKHNNIQNWPDDLPAYLDNDIPNPKALEFNQIWIEQTIRAEYYIYDIGRNGYSPFYHGVELPALQNYNYGRVYKVAYKVTYIKTITIKILILYK